MSRTDLRCRLIRFLLTLSVLAAFLPGSAAADIYRYVDERGIVCFTDNPHHDGYQVHLRTGGRRRTTVSKGYYPYRSTVLEASRRYDIEEPLLRAVIEVESDFNRYAISSAGARGLMQLMPETMKYLGVANPWDPKQNIMGGARYLKYMVERFSGNLSLALAAYNAGANSVIKYGRIPPYPQTRRYVRKVMTRYHDYSGESMRN